MLTPRRENTRRWRARRYGSIWLLLTVRTISALIFARNNRYYCRFDDNCLLFSLIIAAAGDPSLDRVTIMCIYAKFRYNYMFVHRSARRLGLAEHREVDGAGFADLGHCFQRFHPGSHERHRSHTGTDNQPTHSRQNRSEKGDSVQRNIIGNLLGPDHDRHEHLGERMYLHEM